MRHYVIYLLKPDIATSYFGKEALIFQLFVEGETVQGELKEIVQKQINYIVATIPTLQMNKTLHTGLKSRTDFYMEDGAFHLKIKPLQSKAVLKIEQNYMTLTASGNYQCEAIFFEIIRQVSPCFFACDIEHRNYGWLNPVKQVNYV